MARSGHHRHHDLSRDRRAGYFAKSILSQLPEFEYTPSESHLTFMAQIEECKQRLAAERAAREIGR